MNIKLANGADVLACVLLADDQAGVLCLYRGQYVVWVAHLLTSGPADEQWHCIDGNYCDSLTKARRVFCSRFLADWAVDRGEIILTGWKV